MTQNTRLVMYLRRHPKYGITQLEATEMLGILRLSERVRELKAAGHRIRKEKVAVPTRWGKQAHVMRYWLNA